MNTTCSRILLSDGLSASFSGEARDWIKPVVPAVLPFPSASLAFPLRWNGPLDSPLRQPPHTQADKSHNAERYCER